MNTELTDTEALEYRLRRGDTSAMPEQQAAYGSRIYQLAFRYMKNHEDV